MTKTGYKILSGCLCAALICTITGASVHAENGALHAPQDTKAASAAAEERASKEDKLSAFPDAAKVSDWAKEALNWAVASGLINGVADANGTASLEPQATATRAQIATILMRWLEK